MNYLKRDQEAVDADVGLLRKVIDDWVAKPPPSRSDAYAALGRLAYRIGASDDSRSSLPVAPDDPDNDAPEGRREVTT